MLPDCMRTLGSHTFQTQSPKALREGLVAPVAQRKMMDDQQQLQPPPIKKRCGVSVMVWQHLVTAMATAIVCRSVVTFKDNLIFDL